MNCQEFETIVNDLAAGRLWDSAKSEQALAHSGDCARCAARLSNERLLSYELGALVREERQIQAPARLKQDLLSAFAVHQAAGAEVVEFPRANRSRRYWALAIAAAAVLGFALIVPLIGWLRDQAPDQAQQTTVPVEPTVAPARNDSVGGDTPVTPPIQATPERGASVAANPRVPSVRLANRRRIASGPVSSDQLGANTEVRSGFIPLTYLNNATADDGGVLIRVEVSRDKLAALGLPLNLERSGETIKADILMGDDGVARAIRLVQ